MLGFFEWFAGGRHNAALIKKISALMTNFDLIFTVELKLLRVLSLGPFDQFLRNFDLLFLTFFPY